MKNKYQREKLTTIISEVTGLSLLNLLIPVILLISGCARINNESKVNDMESHDHNRPTWVSEIPLVFVGNWDAMPIFKRRIGGNPVWQQDAYYREHKEEAVLKYKEMGVTMMLLHFYKGFGLEAEKEHIEEAKNLAEICRRNGLKVGVYVGSTIGFETFLAEKPEAADWFVPDYMGQPVVYGDQTFRKRVYFMHPGYIEYMKNVLRIAVQDIKADLIHFDNTSMQAEPVIFHHPLAVKNFRKYLERKYTPVMLQQRFGFSDMRFLEPPKISWSPDKIDDPLFQEWTDFRCRQLEEYYGIMESYIHSLNPDVAIDNNPHSGLSGVNTAWKQGIDYPGLLRNTDFIWTEEGNDPMITDDGILISKIRTYKMARTLNNRIFTYTSDSRLEMAEAMAYNRQVLGMVSGLKEMEGNQVVQGYELPVDQKNYIDFFHRHFDCYRDISGIADVAVLHSYASMAFNGDRPYQSTYLLEQVLIQKKIPFDIIFDDQLKDLGKYRVLVLADQECLNADKVDLIVSFVKKGGGLVATEFTSLYSEWRERRSDFGLKELFKVPPPSWNGRSSSESVLNIPVQRNETGNGRVVYIPEIQPSIPKPSGADMSARYWKLPLNSETLADAVKWAAGKVLSLSVRATDEVTMEYTKSVNNEKLMIHLVNYGMLRKGKVNNIDIDLSLPEGKQVSSLELLSPDSDCRIPLNFKLKDGRIYFTVPFLEIYDLIVVSLK